jgi:hypothetical protein
MKILSIDVGMKHLAYCLIEIKGNTFTIDKWDVINLCREENKKICMGKTKSNKPCDKLAKFFKCETNNDVQKCEYYCKTHFKKRKYLIPPTSFKEKNIKKLKLKALKQLVETHKITIDKKKPLKVDYLSHILSHIDENYFNFVETYNANSFNLITYGRTLKERFTKLLKNIELDCVLVENQIGPLALRMKTLQGMIMQHFIERNCLIIEEISPMNKLKNYINTKTTYNERKKLGIEITLKKLNEIPEIATWKPHFAKHKKKDDLADSFLQVLWYIENSKLLKI